MLRRNSGSLVVVTLLASAGILQVCVPVDARVGIMRGVLPTSWAPEILALKEHSRWIDVGHGIQETVFEIRLKDRAAFETAWPLILDLADTGAPITLESGTSYYAVSGTELKGPGVRILTGTTVEGSSHVRGRARIRDGSWVDIGPPWPDYLQTDDGLWPAYAALTDKSFIDGSRIDPPQWMPWEHGEERAGMAHRVRTEIVLVVDGEIVDLNRIKLPPDTPIVDNREIGDSDEDD